MGGGDGVVGFSPRVTGLLAVWVTSCHLVSVLFCVFITVSVCSIGVISAREMYNRICLSRKMRTGLGEKASRISISNAYIHYPNSH